MAAFLHLSQVLDGEERVIRVPESSLSTWLPRGWMPCAPPARKPRPVAAKPAEIRAVAPAPVKPAPKKAERSSAIGREPIKSEDNI